MGAWGPDVTSATCVVAAVEHFDLAPVKVDLVVSNYAFHFLWQNGKFVFKTLTNTGVPGVGDAIHAYPRPGYGYAQSNGCAEVPPWQGATVYGYEPVGTLVTVTT